MALIVHQTHLSGRGYSALTTRNQPWSRVVKLRCFVDFQLVGRTDGLASLRHRFQFRGQSIILPKEKPFKISSFKNNGQNDGADEIDRDSKFSKKSVRLSHPPREREVGTTSSDSLSYASADREDTVSRSQAIERLFKKWLTMLHINASSGEMNGIYNKRTFESETSENQVANPSEKVENMLKAAFMWFMGLDATIRIPLLIFVPWYFMTRVVYGIEVTKELTPLWALGPFITALYIKIIQGICFLYVFCFKQVVRLVENVPGYIILIYSHLTEGKLEAFLYTRFCQPIVDIKNMDYKALLRGKLKQLKEWAVEKYVDYVESVWPYYCRTIRFLKKANLL